MGIGTKHPRRQRKALWRVSGVVGLAWVAAACTSRAVVEWSPAAIVHAPEAESPAEARPLSERYLPGRADPAEPPVEVRVMSEEGRAIHLLGRATYGARREDIEEVLRQGVDAWLERQLAPGSIDDTALERRLVAVTPGGSQMGAVATASGSVTVLTPMQRGPVADAANAGSGMAGAAGGAMSPSREASAAAATSPSPSVITMIPIDVVGGLKLVRAVHSERQLEQVMTDFWFNHFNVFSAKGLVRFVIEDYEAAAIRPNVFGRFADMLLATAAHPAMLVYLDNVSSTAPGGEYGGLNENYARELLELHTLGVDGGYTQRDIVEVARAFTGWTIRPRPSSQGVVAVTATITFDFAPELHDSGEKVVLGRTLPAGRGVEDGVDVLEMLARHPATAEHIATKLVRHFIVDEPPPALVAELAAVFRETDGDLREVTRALFTAEAFYDPAHETAKVKRPFEFVASALRLTGAEFTSVRHTAERLRALGHLPYLEPAPTGYPTTSDEWLSAGAMLGRMDLALDLTAGRVPGVSIPIRETIGALLPPAIDPGPAPMLPPADAVEARSPSDRLFGGPPIPNDPPGEHRAALRAVAAAVVERVLPGVPADQLQAVIVDDIAALDSAEPEAIAARALGLVLGSPRFQRY